MFTTDLCLSFSRSYANVSADVTPPPRGRLRQGVPLRLPPPSYLLRMESAHAKKVARLLRKSQSVRDALLQKQAKRTLVRPPAASPPRSSRTPEDQQAYRADRQVHRKKAQEVQRSHVRDVRAAMAAAAVFQEPVAPSAQQLRHQLHGFVNEGVICRALGPEWRAGNEMRVTEAATRLQACSPALEPSRLNTHALMCVGACRWCRHVKPSRTRSTRCAKGRSNSSPRTAKHERSFAASFAARRRWRARWHLGVQPQQGRGGDLSLLRTTLEASVQRTGGVSSVSVIKMRFNHTSKLDLYMFRLASQTTPSPQSTHIINHLLYTGSNTSNRRQRLLAAPCTLHHLSHQPGNRESITPSAIFRPLSTS